MEEQFCTSSEGHWTDIAEVWLFNIVLGLHSKVLVLGGYRGGFCVKLLEAYLMSDGENASQLKDVPTTSQGQAHQQLW